MYRKALENFAKSTGGGSGDKFAFHDYCDRKHRVQSWIYLLDSEHEFFLASKVNTETPAGVQNEPGFDSENEMDSDAVNAVNNIGLRSSSTKKKTPYVRRRVSNFF
jgi:hypothetical protein